MRKLYQTLIRLVEKLVLNIHISKMWLAESAALIRKTKLINKVKWTDKEKADFNKFWKTNYGEKISSRGVKLYQSFNGIFKADYFPDKLFATKLEPMLNPYYYAKIFSDKSITELIYSNIQNVCIPKTYLINSNGIFYDGERKIIDQTTAYKLVEDIGEFIMKPTVGSSSGFGILIGNIKNGVDQKSRINVSELLRKADKNYLIQEKMFQHESISLLHPRSINTIRIITYIVNSKLYSSKLSLRMGTEGRHVDNIHSGGLVIGVSNDGYLNKYAYRLGYSDTKEIHAFHPDTNVIFEGYKIQGTQEIILAAKILHGRTPNIGIISWDFMVTKSGLPAIIEANYYGQAIWFPQIVHGETVFGNQTSDMIKLIKKTK